MINSPISGLQMGAESSGVRAGCLFSSAIGSLVPKAWATGFGPSFIRKGLEFIES